VSSSSSGDKKRVFSHTPPSTTRQSSHSNHQQQSESNGNATKKRRTSAGAAGARSASSGGVVCRLCGGSHFSDACSETVCGVCSRFGHRSDKCVQQRVDLVRLVPCAQCNQLDHDTVECNVGDEESSVFWSENSGSCASLCFWCGRDHLGQLCPSWLTSMRVRFNFIDPQVALSRVSASAATGARSYVRPPGAPKLTRKERAFLRRTSAPFSKPPSSSSHASIGSSNAHQPSKKKRTRNKNKVQRQSSGDDRDGKQQKAKKNDHKGKKSKKKTVKVAFTTQKKKGGGGGGKWNNVD
jgi:hypothetical protein